MARRLPWLLVLFALGAAVWMLRDAAWPGAGSVFGTSRHGGDEWDGEGGGEGEAVDPIEEAWDAAVRLAGARNARAPVPTAPDGGGAATNAEGANGGSAGAVVRFGGLVIGPDGRPAPGIAVLLDGVGGANAVTAETGPNGRFSLEVPAGRYHLLLSGEEFGGLRLPHYLIDGARGTELEFTLKRVVTYEVALRRRTEGIADAQVSLVPTQGPGGEEKPTDVAGIVVFEKVIAGAYQLKVVTPTGETVWRQVRLTKDASLKIDMPPGVRMRGIVENREEGGPVAGAAVSAVVRGPSSTAITVSTVSESDGRFEMEVPRGVVIRFAAVADDYAPWPRRKDIRKALKSVAGIAKGREVEVRIPLERGLILTGVVSDPDGKPLEGIALTIQPRRGLALDATSDAEGRYEVRGVRPERYSVVVLSDGYFPEGALSVAIPRLSPGEAHTYDVTVHPTIAAQGQVFHAEQKPAAGARVWITARGQLLRAAHRAGRSLETFTDASGWWRITDLPPAQSVRVRASLGSLEATPRGFQTNDLPKQPIRLVLAPTVLLKGVVLDIANRQPIRGARVLLRPEGAPTGRTNRTLYSDAEGNIEVPDLIPGVWLLTPSRKNYLVAEPERIDLAKTDREKSVTLHLDPGLAIGGAVSDLEGRPLKNARAIVSGTDRDGKRVRQEARTDARGAFRLTGFRTGVYKLWVRRSGYRNAAIDNLQGGEDRLALRMRPR